MKLIGLPCLAILFQLFVLGLNSVPPAPSVLSPILLANNTTYGFPSLDNTTFTNATNVLPQSPWTYNVPQTSIQVTAIFFEVIGISHEDLLACLLHAATDVIAQIDNGIYRKIGQRELAWDSKPVRLNLYPEPEMTWAMWGATIRGLTHFLDMYESVAILFDARDLQLKKTVGGGGIHNLKPTTENNDTEAYQSS